MAVTLKQSQIKAREMRGLAIVNRQDSQIERVSDYDYEVLSQSGNGSYLVTRVYNQWYALVQTTSLERLSASISRL